MVGLYEKPFLPMIHYPSLPFSGLHILLDHPSRFDLKSIPPKLLSGYVETIVYQGLGTIPKNSCVIADIESYTPEVYKKYPPLVILSCGKNALKLLTGETDLSARRGSISYTASGIPVIPTFYPQDTCDIIDYESKFNPYNNQENSPIEDEEEEDTSEGKGHGATSRSHYRFWFIKDLQKATRWIKNKGKPSFVSTFKKEHKIFPLYEEVIEFLKNVNNTGIVLDLETRINKQKTILCIGLSALNSNVVYVIPIWRYNNTLHYGYENTLQIFKHLTLALNRNLTITHNSNFDIHVLCHFYNIYLGRRQYDTMAAMHRCFPGMEKSLGHCISLWTDLPYHKDEGNFSPTSEDHEVSLYRYNAKDVEATEAVYNAIELYASKDQGLRDSIDQSNRMIYPYLVNELYGVRVNNKKLQDTLKRNDKTLTQYQRILNLLVGFPLNPGSSKQVCGYLYDIMELPCKGKRSSDEDSLREILVKNPIPALQVILKMRSLAKESSILSNSLYYPGHYEKLQPLNIS